MALNVARLLPLAMLGALPAAGDEPGAAPKPPREIGSVRALAFQHGRQLRHVAFSPDSRLMAFLDWKREAGTGGGFLHTIHVADAATNQVVRRITPAEGGPLGAPTFAPDGKHLAAVHGSAVYLWEARTGTPVRTFTPPERPAGDRATFALTHWLGLAFSPDGKTLAAVGSERRGIAPGDIDPSQLTPLFQLWDVATGKSLPHTRGRAGASYQLVGFAAGGKVLAWEHAGRLLDLMTGAAIFTNAPEEGHTGLAALSPDRKTCVWADTKYDEWALHIADVTTGKETGRVPGHAGSTTALAFAGDGKVFASAGGGGTIKLHDTATGKVLHTLHETDHRISCLAFAPDGRTLASGGLEGVVCVWDATAGTRRARLLGDRGWVQSVQFSPDGRLLAAGRTYAGRSGEGIGEAFLWAMPAVR